MWTNVLLMCSVTFVFLCTIHQTDEVTNDFAPASAETKQQHHLYDDTSVKLKPRQQRHALFVAAIYKE